MMGNGRQNILEPSPARLIYIRDISIVVCRLMIFYGLCHICFICCVISLCNLLHYFTGELRSSPNSRAIKDENPWNKSQENSLATLNQYLSNTVHGIKLTIPPNILHAAPIPNPPNNAAVTSGNTAPNIFRQKLCAARALLAYL